MTDKASGRRRPRRQPVLPDNVVQPLGAMSVDALNDWAQHTGQMLWIVDCGGCETKRDVLAAIAETLALPEWFGLNFDALYDALADLPGQAPAAGYVLVLERLPQGPGFTSDDRDALLAVLADVVDDYAQRKIPLRVLYR